MYDAKALGGGGGGGASSLPLGDSKS